MIKLVISRVQLYVYTQMVYVYDKCFILLHINVKTKTHTLTCTHLYMNILTFIYWYKSTWAHTYTEFIFMSYLTGRASPLDTHLMRQDFLSILIFYFNFLIGFNPYKAEKPQTHEGLLDVKELVTETLIKNRQRNE